jgi:hypothetical protein
LIKESVLRQHIIDILHGLTGAVSAYAILKFIARAGFACESGTFLQKYMVPLC